MRRTSLAHDRIHHLSVVDFLRVVTIEIRWRISALVKVLILIITAWTEVHHSLVLSFTTFDQTRQLLNCSMRHLLPLHIFPECFKIRSFSLRIALCHLLLLDCINQLFDGLFQEVNVLHFQGLVFLQPCFDREKSSLVELLRFDDHFDPLILLLLQICNDGLVIDQMLLVFGEILGADVFDLL